MLQNWVGNGIGPGFNPLTASRNKFVNLVKFWKQDGNSSSNFKDQTRWLTKKKRENSS